MQCLRVILEHQCQILDDITFVWGEWGQGQFRLLTDIDILRFGLSRPPLCSCTQKNYRTISFFVLFHHMIRSHKSGNTEENALSTYNFGITKCDMLKILLFKVNAHRQLVECESM